MKPIEIGSGKSFEIAVKGGIAKHCLAPLSSVYLDSLGYAKEGKNDVGESFSFVFGTAQVPNSFAMNCCLSVCIDSIDPSTT